MKNHFINIYFGNQSFLTNYALGVAPIFKSFRTLALIISYPLVLLIM